MHLQLLAICGNITIVRDTTNKYNALTERSNKMSLAELKARFDNGFESFDQVVMFIQFVAENASPDLFDKKLLSFWRLNKISVL